VDELLVAVQEDRFRFAAGLAEQDAMSRALTGYRRVVRDDGVIGSELVVALLLALIPSPPTFEPMIALGGSLFFGPRDQSEGAHVPGLRLVRSPDGSLVGITEQEARE
jgi:hypothetical protein